MKRSLALALTIGILAMSAAVLGGAPPAAASSVPACTARQLSARIVDWSGAMGSTIADVVLVNTSFTKCSLRDLPQVQLVGANGTSLIVGVPASTTAPTHGLNPLAFVKTEVGAGNYCGPAYKRPVTLAFLLPGHGGSGRGHAAIADRLVRRAAVQRRARFGWSHLDARLADVEAILRPPRGYARRVGTRVRGVGQARTGRARHVATPAGRPGFLRRGPPGRGGFRVARAGRPTGYRTRMTAGTRN